MKATDIEVLKSRSEKLRIEANSIETLLVEKIAIEKTIADIAHLRQHAGRMIFTGQSGKVGDTINIREIYINSISGCVSVPALLMELANSKLNKVDFEIQELLGR